MKYDDNLRSTAQLAAHPIHPMLVPFPIACFVGTLVTDIAYWRTAQMMWADFSAWLLLIGMVMGVLAAIAGLIDFLGNRLIRAQQPAWPHMLGNILCCCWPCSTPSFTPGCRTSVVPLGLVLSVITVLILPVTGWLGWSMVYRHGVGAVQVMFRHLKSRDARACRG